MADYNELDIDILRSNTVGRYHGRLPDPAELLAWGGQPGTQYAMVAGQNVTAAKELDWQLCRDVASVTVSGPEGACELVVMAKGDPINGASPANGIRRWQYDPTLLALTGIKDPTEPELKADPTPRNNAAAAAKAKAAAALPQPAPAA